MIDVLFISHSNSTTNTYNFVPVALASVVADQPELGWDRIAHLSYTHSLKTDLGPHPAKKFEIAGHTIYHANVLNPMSIRKTEQQIRKFHPEALFVIGGPIAEEIAVPALLRANADFFFSGSALWSFRKFCEHVDACRQTGVELDREYLRTLPGLYQRIGNEVIPPLSTVQPTDFIGKLVLDPSPLFEYDSLTKPRKRFDLPYPMLRPCPGKCSFCNYNPIGVPLTHEQKREYVRRARELASPDRAMVLDWFGPNFDFSDQWVLDNLIESKTGYPIMTRVVSLLEPGEVGKREPNRARIERIMSPYLRRISLGVECLTEQIRDEMGKDRFTNDELERVLLAIAEVKNERDYKNGNLPTVCLFMLPPDISTSFITMGSDTVILSDWYQDFAVKHKLVLQTSWQTAVVNPYPNTPDFELLKIFQERFPKLFGGYFRGGYRIMPGSERQALYSGSFPLDPVVFSTLYGLIKLIRNTDEPNPEMIYARSYLRFLGLYTYGKQWLDSGTSYDKPYDEALREFVPIYAQLVERMEHFDLLKDLGKKSISDLRREFDENYKRKGRERMKREMERTPLRDPDAYRLWDNLGDIRKAMVIAKKQGDPNWKAVGRKLAFA